jgi:hypothetical protein
VEILDFQSETIEEGSSPVDPVIDV